MNFETFAYFAAVLGVILTIVGRWIIRVEAYSVSDGWGRAVRFLPLADIMFLARYWELAKGGAFISIAGMVCFLPIAGKVILEQKPEVGRDPVAAGRALSVEHRARIFEEMKADHKARIEARGQKLQQLNAHMATWYASMNERRAQLTDGTPEQLAVFNEEAAAYQSLHTVTKAEAAELQAMMSRQLSSTNDISDEEYGRFIQREHRQMMRLFRGLGSEEDGEGDDEEG